MKVTKSLYLAAVLTGSISLASCSLEEDNPGGFTMGNIASNSVESYEGIVNQCYFGLQRGLYGTDGFMEITEGDTDLWTYRANINSSNT